MSSASRSSARDLDDLTAPFLEVLATNGNYYWVPIERVERIQFQEPKVARDLIWRELSWWCGVVRMARCPCRPAMPARTPRRTTRCGSGMTDWRGGDGTPVRGSGSESF